jgi:hypothetical protein
MRGFINLNIIPPVVMPPGTPVVYYPCLFNSLFVFWAGNIYQARCGDIYQLRVARRPYV